MQEVTVKVPDGYESLFSELMEAFKQASEGKGQERHADGRTFENQPIIQIATLYGTGFLDGQAAKKTEEANRLDPMAGLREVHGAMIYLAAKALILRRKVNEEADLSML